LFPFILISFVFIVVKEPEELVIVLLVKVSEPDNVARVPDAGNITSEPLVCAVNF